MADVRVEKDSLGPVNVPAGAYYGAQTQRAVENFPISGLKPYPAFIWAITMVKRAAAEVHLDLGLMDEKMAKAIMQALAMENGKPGSDYDASIPIAGSEDSIS